MVGVMLGLEVIDGVRVIVAVEVREGVTVMVLVAVGVAVSVGIGLGVIVIVEVIDGLGEGIAVGVVSKATGRLQAASDSSKMPPRLLCRSLGMRCFTPDIR